MLESLNLSARLPNRVFIVDLNLISADSLISLDKGRPLFAVHRVIT